MSTHGGIGSIADAGAGAGSHSPDMSSRDVSAILKKFLERLETPTELGLGVEGLDGFGLHDGELELSQEGEHESPDLSGAKLGSVLIERRLGEGGMGEVWLGHEEDLDIPVAVKVLPARYAGNQAAVLRFLREARAVARLDHPNIVRVLQSGRREHAGVYLRVMVMEYVEGCDAYEALGDCPGRRMDPKRAAEVVLGAARALKHAHSRGVTHRDIKPSNLLLPSEGGVKVADFGLSQVAGTGTQTGARGTGAGAAQGNLTMAGMVMGTPAYMSPEQGRGLGADGRSDVYSLGITLYELLTGQPPFQAGDAMSMIRMHIEEPIPFQAGNLESIPPVMRELIEGMCRKLPDDRMGTDAVIELLTRYLGRAATPGYTEAAQAVIPPTRTNIAARDTSFVGREPDLAALDKLYENGARLVTVMGPGGVGKTRLVQEFGLREATRRGQYPGGIWFCDLTEARNPESLAAATARGMGMNLLQGEPVQQVHMALRMRGASLLILDNFEQVAEHALETVGAWLRDTPHVRFLVSSREPLHIEAERLFALDALVHDGHRKTPHSGVRMIGRTTPGHTRTQQKPEPDIPPAVRLFADRASMASREFRLTAENAGLVGQICAELDGIPLAIELAAARVGSMTIRQVLDRLPKRFELLTSRRRDASARQATMRGAIDWSWDLLEPWERLALAQCGVFIDGFLMDAAEKVIDLSAFPEAPFTLDVVETLVEKSLVRAQEHPGLPGETRYRMYESIRDYASRRMAEAGSAGPGERLRELTGEAASAALRQRHAEYYAAYAGLWSRRLPTGASREAVERVGMELGNLFSAQDAMETVNPVLSAKVALAFRDTLKIRGPWQPRVERLTRAVGAAGDMPGLKAELLVALALAHFDAGNRAGMEAAASEAEALARSLAAASPSAETLKAYGAAIGMLGQVASRTGNMDQALDCYAKAEAVFRGIRDDAMLAQNFGRRGQIHAMRGQSSVAIPMFQEAEKISRRLGNGPGISAAVGNLGLLHSDAGDHAGALGMFAEAERIDREQGNVLGVASWIGSRGNTLLAMGEGEAALECFTEAEQLCRELGARAAMTTWLSNRGLALNRVGRFGEALEVFGEAEAVNRQVGNLRSLSYNLLGRARALAGTAMASGASRGESLERALEAVTECQALRQKLGMHKSPMYFTSLAEHAAILGMLAAHAGVTTNAGAARAREARIVADEALALAGSLGLGRDHHEPEVRMAFAALDRAANL